LSERTLFTSFDISRDPLPSWKRRSVDWFEQPHNSHLFRPVFVLFQMTFSSPLSWLSPFHFLAPHDRWAVQGCFLLSLLIIPFPSVCHDIEVSPPLRGSSPKCPRPPHAFDFCSIHPPSAKSASSSPSTPRNQPLIFSARGSNLPPAFPGHLASGPLSSPPIRVEDFLSRPSSFCLEQDLESSYGSTNTGLLSPLLLLPLPAIQPAPFLSCSSSRPKICCLPFFRW